MHSKITLMALDLIVTLVITRHYVLCSLEYPQPPLQTLGDFLLRPTWRVLEIDSTRPAFLPCNTSDMEPEPDATFLDASPVDRQTAQRDAAAVWKSMSRRTKKKLKYKAAEKRLHEKISRAKKSIKSSSDTISLLVNTGSTIADDNGTIDAAPAERNLTTSELKTKHDNLERYLVESKAALAVKGEQPKPKLKRKAVSEVKDDEVTIKARKKWNTLDATVLAPSLTEGTAPRVTVAAGSTTNSARRGELSKGAGAFCTVSRLPNFEGAQTLSVDAAIEEKRIKLEDELRRQKATLAVKVAHHKLKKQRLAAMQS